MGQFRVARVWRHYRLQPACIACRGNLRKKCAEPCAELADGQYAPHEVRFAKTRREKVFAGGFVCQRAILIIQIELSRFGCYEVSELLVLGAARVVEHKTERKGGLIVLTDAYRIR